MQVLQLASSAAFVALGVAAATGWLRRRDRSLGWLALAIGLLAIVSLSGTAVTLLDSLFHIKSPILGDLTLIAFIASAYALLRYRASFIPISPAWHGATVVAIVLGTITYFAAQLLAANGVDRAQLMTASGIVLVVMWAGIVTESIVRFWLVAHDLAAVQAWRLRSLSLGFAAIVLVLVFSVAAALLGGQPIAQVVTQLVAIAIVPLLYVSFAPPAWLRREWRSAEEEGLRTFMEELLLSEDRDALSRRALEWSMRLTGGAAAVAFDAKRTPRTVVGIGGDEVQELKSRLPELEQGVQRIRLNAAQRTALVLPIRGLADSATLVVLAGPFTPGFGADEMNRVQQFMSAFVTALDRRQLIVQLEETNSQLVDANRHKSVFLASMSHELRTPLNAILGFSELLMDTGKETFTPETRHRFLEQIHSSGKHLLGLINDILDLSKIEAGQMELRLQVVNIAEIVEQVRNTVEPLAIQKSITLKSENVDAGSIIADPGKVKQMLLNLVSNAIKFTPDNGMVTIRATRLNDAVEMSVIDTGIGIAKEDFGRVFREFQQLDSGVGRQQPGTGLGLTLTRRFANLHGGDVRMDSEPGVGSTFTITLPLEAHRVVAAPQPVQVDRPPVAVSRPLVLVVEDDPAAAELLIRQIERAGFRTQVARTGSQALAAARAQKPAAITLDILLPDLDGWEVLTQLKNDPATSHIPVVVVSVVDNPELGIALGALDYFVKPVSGAELMSRLARFRLGRTDADKATVLVVDDEEPNREWLRRLLEPEGFSVILASGGQEAIDIARATSPDLIMLDLMMPNVTGFDVVEALRAKPATQNIPIMVLTAKTLTEADIRQLHGHVSTILRRGSTGAADLLDLLKQVVSNSGVQ
jgi:signal transduction histidine kinase/DNA-binding response OmpR family regulator